MNPNPFVIDVPIDPKFEADGPKLRSAVAELAANDSSLGFTVGEQGGIVLKGLSEERLDAAVDLLKRECACDLLVGAPQVAYRERLTKRLEVSYTLSKLLGAFTQFAKARINFEPVAIGTGSSFQSMIADGAVRLNIFQASRRGLASALKAGVLAGFPVVDVKATLIDGAYHEADSSELAFEIGARSAAREALQKGGEPVMKIETTAPEEHPGFVVGDLRSRRGEALGQDRAAWSVVVNVLVLLANMFGYGSTLRSGTRGRGSFTMRFSHYAIVSRSRGGDDSFPPAIGVAGLARRQRRPETRPLYLSALHGASTPRPRVAYGCLRRRKLRP